MHNPLPRFLHPLRYCIPPGQVVRCLFVSENGLFSVISLIEDKLARIIRILEYVKAEVAWLSYRIFMIKSRGFDEIIYVRRFYLDMDKGYSHGYKFVRQKYTMIFSLYDVSATVFGLTFVRT